MDKPINAKADFNQMRRKFIKQGLGVVTCAGLSACGESSTPPQAVIPPSISLNSTPGALAEASSPLNIVIIGAGMSGLIAGYELLRAGHQVTVLEARNRSGGRVHTLNNIFDNGQFAEAGASRIPSNHELTLAYIQHFDLNIEPFYPNANNYFNLQNNSSSIIPWEDYLNQPPWPGSVNRSDYYKISDGMAKLPLALSSSINDNIIYSAPVDSVRQSNDGVEIYANNQQFLADRLLCTVPLPVLNKISFSPALSAEKTLASNGGFDYTDSTRLYTQFSERFWLEDNLNAWGNTNWPEEIWQPTWNNQESSGIIQSYLRGIEASDFDTFDLLQQIESVHGRWQYVLPQLANFIIKSHVHSWQKERWTGSAYASPTNAQSTALASHVGLTEGRLHFAGEHASQFHGWIQGAIASGIRAAEEIHAMQ